MKNIIGRKVGMTSIFTADGRYVGVTVIEARPNIVLRRKTVESDGYESVALAAGDINKKRVNKPMNGIYKTAGIEPKKVVREFRRHLGDTELKTGDAVTVASFAEGDHIDATGISKGHGFTGGMKRHNFSGGGRSHGSMIHRQPASNGDTNAGHVLKGSRRPGHYGVDRTTVQNLEIVRVDTERNLLLVRGPVPGPRNAYVLISAAVRPPYIPPKVEEKK